MWRDGYDRLVLDLSIKNAGAKPIQIEGRHFARVPGAPRTDYLWIFSRSSGMWLAYTGPHGRLRRPRPGDFVVLDPGSTRTIKDVDITDSYELPAARNAGLVAKVLFEDPWGVLPPESRIESRCTPLPARP